jgi:hypothetical protein
VVFIFKKHPLPTFSLSVSRLENTVKIGVFGFAMSWHVFGPFLGCWNFNLFLFGFGGPLKTFKKTKENYYFSIGFQFSFYFFGGRFKFIKQMSYRP